MSVSQMEEEYMVRNLRQYALVNNELADRCFCSCIGSLTSKKLTVEEQECVDGCAAKLIKATTRMVMKVAEQNPMGLGRQNTSSRE